MKKLIITMITVLCLAFTVPVAAQHILDNGAPIEITYPEGYRDFDQYYKVNAFWSPDGKWIAFMVQFINTQRPEDGTEDHDSKSHSALCIVPAEGGEAKIVYEHIEAYSNPEFMQSAAGWDLNFTPDSRELTFTKRMFDVSPKVKRGDF